MSLLIIAFATFFDIMIIKWKWAKKRYEDATFDFLLFVSLIAIFHGSFAGMVVAAATAVMISIYFLISPPQFFTKVIREASKRSN
jgi:hypothetical protein